MTSRMDRYRTTLEKQESRRLSKNKKIYEDLYTSTSYVQFTDANSDNMVDKSISSFPSRREEYQKNRKFSDILPSDPRLTRSYDPFSPILLEENKIYDINSVLEDAKKNRDGSDELEKKRKLRTTEYDILTNLSQEKLQEHREKKKEVLTVDEEEELEELIHTITSRTMRQELDQELLGNLMATKSDETLISDQLQGEIQQVDQANYKTPSETTSEILQLDQSFYTKSMDLSDHDLLDAIDSEDLSFRESTSKKSLIIKIFISIIIIILVVVILFIIYNSIVGG